MAPWKKYLVIGLVVMVLILTATQANAQRMKEITADGGEWQKAIEESLDVALNGTQKDSVEQIVQAFAQHGDGDHRKLAYILATAWHESRLKPIKEYRAKAGTSAYERQNRYWPSGYYGRGFVQLTWKENYEEMGEVVGADLVSSPDLALNVEYAAKIIVYGMMNGTFTGKKLGRYISAITKDYYNARRVVNGTDKASLIKGYAEKIEKGVS